MNKHSKRFAILSPLAASILMSVGFSAQAATFTVTNTKEDGSEGSFGAALLSANANEGLDTIILPRV